VSQPDLFVVCRNCGSEVSPYVTECPYCGQRIRRRAPKIERHDDDEPRPRRRRRLRGRLSRQRADAIEGIAPETRPVATIALIAASLALTLALSTGAVGLLGVGGILVPLDGDPWRYVTAPFVHDNLGYQFVALLAVALFGSMLEARFGRPAPVAIFLLAGAAGAAAAVAADVAPPFESVDIGYLVLGANGAALGLLFAWLVEDRIAARRGIDRGNDMIGVAAFAAVLLALPLAVAEASPVAGVAGAVTGAVIGLLLPLLGRS
jgi:membrane associated rhomboid family serine protease